jgi:hypothetical protein
VSAKVGSRFLFIDTPLRDLTGHHCEILPVYTKSVRQAIEAPAWFARLFSFRRDGRQADAAESAEHDHSSGDGHD